MKEKCTYIYVNNKQYTGIKVAMLLIMFVCNRGDAIQYQGGLLSRELCQAPMLLVFLTPRQALSSHPHAFIMILLESMNFHPD